jgi:tetratricopeptide (TPR) repeat protein/tRNA A-37 threonylcarbamoyl transferase component Bud32/TolB-like protein
MTDPAARLTEALSDRYRILKEAGAGGMATVFLAEDVKHRRKVAVKVLRPELAASLGAQRFLREIEIAAGLQHPNIVGLLDSGAFASAAGGPDDRPYYVMPFVEGESLRQRLARSGELPVGEAVRLLCEITDALAHAHRRGVVHRDMKPDNVMLSERHALVTDFGVAKAVTEAHGSDHQATSVGMALGTPAYMSPEQAAADPHVDHRADIYAIGAMAYELLAGRPPFTGGSPQQVLMAQVTQAPDPLSAHRPNLPPGLEQAIMRCLAKRPADRFQTADELLAAFELHATSSASTTPASTAPVRAVQMPNRWYGHPVRVAALFGLASAVVLGLVWLLTKQIGLPTWVLPGAVALLALGLPIMLVTGWAERRRAVAQATGMFHASAETGLHRLTWQRSVRGGVLAFGALALVVVGYIVMRLAGIGPVGTLLASGKLAASDRIVVADFENRTSDSTLGTSVTEAFRIDLAQSPVVRVVPAATINEALTRMGRKAGGRFDATTAREVAVRENAKAVVVGEISPVGKGLVLSARLVSSGDGTELVALRETAPDEGGVLEAIDRLSKGMRERFGESLKRLRNTEPLEQVTTNSLEALRLYTQGERAFEGGDYDEAMGLMRQAIAADSNFAMAWRKLAVTLGNTNAGQSERIAAATKAFQLRDRLPEKERYLADAFYYFTADYQAEKIVSAYRAVLQIDPDDPTALNNLSIQLLAQGKAPEAEQLLRHAVDLKLPGPTFHNNLIQSLLTQLKNDEALTAMDSMEARRPGGPEVAVQRAGVLNALARYDSAEIVIRAAIRTNLPPSTEQVMHGQLASVLALRGRLGESLQERQRQQELMRRRGQPWNVMAIDIVNAMMLVTQVGDQKSALRILDSAVAANPMSAMPAVDRPYVLLAQAYALAGAPARATEVLTEHRREVPPEIRNGDTWRHVAQGNVDLAEGRPREALEAFRTYLKEDACAPCVKAFEARAWEALGQPDSAIAAYQVLATPGGHGLRFRTDGAMLSPALKRMGELQEERGDKAGAIETYTRVLQNWSRADAALQPQVKEVKQRLANLTGEPEPRP